MASAWEDVGMAPRFAGVRAVLFDVDGTLLDTTEFIFRAYEHAASVAGVASPGREWLRMQIGRKLEDVYEDFAPGRSETLIELHRGFQSANITLGTAFPGTVETLRALRSAGVRMAAVTSRSNRTSVDSLVSARIDEFFDAVISAEDAEALKPDPAPLRVACERLVVAAAETVMVGDSTHDVHAAQAFGIPVIAATYGFPGVKVLEANPTASIGDIRELLPLVV